ncbi:MAG: 30S ribosomal protein S20 [Microgenomates group bacterium]
MPITKSAIKKMKKDKKRKKANLVYLNSIKKIFNQLKKAVAKGTKDISELIKKYYSVIDKAAKRKIIHKNKANRLKSKVKKFLKTK